MFSNRINYKRERILRILVRHNDGNIGNASGFFIDKEGSLLTCFHVAFGEELRNIREFDDFKSIQGDNEHSKLEQWFANKIDRMDVEFPDGSKEELQLYRFDEKYDIALLKLRNQEAFKKIRHCKLDFKAVLKQEDQVFFGGFPICFPYANAETPFAINAGMVSSFPETIVGGDRYEHIQINSINLGGNSGAPLFRKNRDKVVGIINGNMLMGRNNVLFRNPRNNQDFVDSPRIPVSIAYATSLKLLKERSTIFN